MNKHSNDVEQKRAIERLDTLAKLLDSQFRVPYTDIRFGVESLLGLLPFYGDFVSFLLSIGIIVLIAKQGVPTSVLIRICLNSLIDFTMGIIPFFGDIADVFFKSNIRNVNIARKYFDSPEKVKVQSKLFIALLILCGILFVVGIFASLLWLTVQLIHLFKSF